MRAAIPLLLATLTGLGCGTAKSDIRSSDSATRTTVQSADSVAHTTVQSDCLGKGAPAIDVGQVGDLQLGLTLRDLKHLCPTLHDSVASGDESLDTAIVISRPGLSVVGRAANIANEEGYRPYTVDSAATIHAWTITGTDGLLPRGVPLSATWDSLVSAYGTPRVDPLNGDVYVWFCQTLPDFVFHFDDRLYLTKPQLVARDSYPSSLKGARIRAVDLPATRRQHPGCAG
jgi:hypothetical protein